MTDFVIAFSLHAAIITTFQVVLLMLVVFVGFGVSMAYRHIVLIRTMKCCISEV